MSTTVWYIIMALGLVGMIWCVKNQKRVANTQVYAVISMLVVLGSAIMALWSYFGDGDIQRMMENSKQFELSKAAQVADFLNKNYAGKSIVILAKSDTIKKIGKDEDYTVDEITELKERLKDVNVLDVVEIPVPDPSEFQNQDPASMPPPMMPEEALTRKVFDEKFNECKNKNPDLILNLAGLPAYPEEAAGLKIWRWKKNDPKVFLYEINAIGDAFSPLAFKGVLAGCVMSKENSTFDYATGTAPDDLKEAFDTRYVIVTGDNLNDLANQKVITVMMPPKK